MASNYTGLTCNICGQPASQGFSVRLGGGYGQSPLGLAIYYRCSSCKPPGDTDMAKQVATWPVRIPQ